MTSGDAGPAIVSISGQRSPARAAGAGRAGSARDASGRRPRPPPQCDFRHNSVPGRFPPPRGRRPPARAGSSGGAARAGGSGWLWPGLLGRWHSQRTRGNRWRAGSAGPADAQVGDPWPVPRRRPPGARFAAYSATRGIKVYTKGLNQNSFESRGGFTKGQAPDGSRRYATALVPRQRG